MASAFLPSRFFAEAELFTSDAILVVADNGNGAIRAINTTGTPLGRWGVALGPDIVEQIEVTGVANPIGLALDAQGSLYATTFTQLHKIAFDRAVVPGSTVIAGSAGTGLPAEGCPASMTSLGTNNGVAIDPATGNAFLGSRHGLVRRIPAAGGTGAGLDPDDCIEFVAGSWDAGEAIPNVGFAGDGGPARSAVLGAFSRPFIDRTGALLVAADGRIRRVTFDGSGLPQGIDTVAGVGPIPVGGMPALDLITVNLLGSIRVDAASNRYLYTTGGWVLGHDRTSGMVSVVAGTGYLGNTFGAGNLATASDLGGLRGHTLAGGSLYLLESTIPRLSAVDLALGTLGVISGDGRAATLAEQQAPGPAAMARVAINTGAPKIAQGPDGALYFGDGNLVRVVNIGAAPLTSFGLSIPPGGIDDLPIGFGSNVSGIAFDVAGDLYVASYDTNAVSRLPAAGPFVPVPVVTGDSQRYGYSAAGLVQGLRLNRPADLLFLPGGHLLVASDFGNTLAIVEADAAGTIGPASRAAHVFGNGAPGRLGPGESATSVSSGRMGALAVDGSDVLFITSDRVVKLTMP